MHLNQNDPKAQCNLGYRYLVGKDVPKDIAKGLELLKSASDNGDVELLDDLVGVIEMVIGVDVDMPLRQFIILLKQDCLMIKNPYFPLLRYLKR